MQVNTHPNVFAMTGISVRASKLPRLYISFAQPHPLAHDGHL